MRRSHWLGRKPSMTHQKVLAFCGSQAVGGNEDGLAKCTLSSSASTAGSRRLPTHDTAVTAWQGCLLCRDGDRTGSQRRTSLWRRRRTRPERRSHPAGVGGRYRPAAIRSASEMKIGFRAPRGRSGRRCYFNASESEFTSMPKIPSEKKFAGDSSEVWRIAGGVDLRH